MRAPRVLFLLSVLAGSSTFAQQSCPSLQVSAPDPSKLLLSPQLEMEFGDGLADRLQTDFLVIDDDDVTSYLRSIGDRLVRQLPQSQIRYQFFLYDQPQINAFGLPGGRIYVSRKMVAFLRNEDELAGLLGHELGHIVTRQGNVAFSRALRDVLDVQSIRDREDLFDKYNELIESRNLRKAHLETRSENDRDQMVADRVGIEATARAGYSPQAFVSSLDRLMQTKGQTGSWLGDLFGATKPDARRLREVLKDVATLPAACVDSRLAAAPPEFRAWQDAVLRYKGNGHKERLNYVISRDKLNSPIRSDIENFQFSPDGKYILAQDDSGISVLTRDPFAFKFRFDTRRAGPAHFSPDSRQILFSTGDFRVETWDIENQERASLSDVSIIGGCLQTALSPDGKFLACFNFEMDLGVFDVASGQEVFHKDRMADFTTIPLLAAMFYVKLGARQDLAVLRYSPDSHYFAASVPGADPILLELPDVKKTRISGTLHVPLTVSFTFVGPDRLLGADPLHPDKWPIVALPSGNVISRVPLGGGQLQTAANPRYVLVRPVKDHPVGIFDLQAQKWVFANRNSAVDIWGDVAVAERLNGEVGLYKLGESKPSAVLQLPLGRIDTLRSASVSPDLRWLAASVRSRGAIWDLQQNERIFFERGFQRSFSVSPQIFYLFFPEFETAKPFFLAFGAGTHSTARRVLEKDDDQILMGKVTIVRKHDEREHDARRSVTFEVLKTENANLLWWKNFPKLAPTVYGFHSPNRLIFIWPTSSDGAKEEFAHNTDLRPNLVPGYSTATDYLVEVVDAETGNLLRALTFNGAKDRNYLESAESLGDWLVISESTHRILLLSLTTGDIKARYFGSYPVLSPTGDLLSVANERGELRLYDTHTLHRLDELDFAENILMDAFSADAKKLLVLTDDQTFYLLDTTKLPAPAATTVVGH
jgi:WD40 repeat protein